MHVIALVILFVSDAGLLHPERFVLHKETHAATIVFLPLHKRVAVPDKQMQSRVDKKNRTIVSLDQYEKKLSKKEKKQEQKKVQALFEPKAVTKEMVVPVAVKTKPVTQIKQEKAVVKKAVEKVVPAAKKSVKKQPIAPAIEPIKDKPVIEKKESKPDSKTLETLPQVLAQEKTVIAPQVVVDHDDHKNDDVPIDLENVQFVGSHDLAMLHVKELIYEQVMHYYKPPVGIAKKAVCECAVVVGKGGTAERVTIQKSSGSMANDMCARAALLKVTYPHEVIGKEIIVELGQS